MEAAVRETRRQRTTPSAPPEPRVIDGTLDAPPARRGHLGAPETLLAAAAFWDSWVITHLPSGMLT